MQHLGKFIYRYVTPISFPTIYSSSKIIRRVATILRNAQAQIPNFSEKRTRGKCACPSQCLTGDWPNNYALANLLKVKDRRCANISQSDEGKAAWRQAEKRRASSCTVYVTTNTANSRAEKEGYPHRVSLTGIHKITFSSVQKRRGTS